MLCGFREVQRGTPVCSRWRDPDSEETLLLRPQTSFPQLFATRDSEQPQECCPLWPAHWPPHSHRPLRSLKVFTIFIRWTENSNLFFFFLNLLSRIQSATKRHRCSFYLSTLCYWFYIWGQMLLSTVCTCFKWMLWKYMCACMCLLPVWPS